MIQKMDDHKAWDYDVAVKQILFRLKLNDLNAIIGTFREDRRKELLLQKFLLKMLTC